MPNASPAWPEPPSRASQSPLRAAHVHHAVAIAPRQVWCCDTTGLVLRHDRSGAATRPICPRPWCRSGSTCSRTSMGQRVRALVQQKDSLRGIQNATPAQRHSGQRVGHDTRAIEITSSSSRSIRSEISLQPDLTIHQGCMIQTTTTLSSTGHAPVV